ncbi:MAG: hypothetical protein Q9160_006648 [Pyrenula sp. 1 TL-2023]
MAVDGSISKAAAACLERFNLCVELEPLMIGEWAENRLADFNLWDAGIGASAKGRASLDSRLALKYEAREIIANLLRLLAEVIDDSIKLARSYQSKPESDDGDGVYRGRQAIEPQDNLPGRSFSPWSDESSSDNQSEEFTAPLSSDPLHENMRNVEKMLDQLARIALSIRQSGRRSRLQKADQRFKAEEHKDLQRYLSSMLVINHPKLAMDQIGSIDLTEVQKRLVHCNLKRRNRFLYAQQHSKHLFPTAKERQQPQASQTAKIVPPIEPGFTLDDERETSPTPDRLDGAKGLSTDPTIKTGTSASAVSEGLALQDALMPTPTASTIMSSTVMNLDYPRPPKSKEGVYAFTCPCCCQTLPVSLSEENRWKPDVLFTTKESWKQHLLKEHRNFEYWICFACGDGTQIPSEETFVQHVRARHTATVKPEQIPILSNVSKRSAPVAIQSCPMCDWPNGEEEKVDENALLDHIAKEVHSFSLRALPWADYNGQESNEMIDYSSRKVEAWLVRNKLSEHVVEERPFHESRICVSDYFRHNPYFAGSSAASSFSDLQSDGSWEEELEKLKKQEGSFSFPSHQSDVVPATGDEAIVDSQFSEPIPQSEREAGLYKIVRAHGQITLEDEAECQQELEADMRELGPEHPNTISSVSRLGLIRARRREYGDAQALYGHALSGREKVLGATHPDTLITKTALAVIFQFQGLWNEAETLAESAVNMGSGASGSANLIKEVGMTVLASVLRDQGRLQEAGELMEWAGKGIYQRGKVNRSTLSLMADIMELYRAKGDLKTALALGTTVSLARQKLLRSGHPDTIQTLVELMRIYKDLGQTKDSVRLGRQALDLSRAEIGVGHSTTLSLQRQLAEAHPSSSFFQSVRDDSKKNLEGRGALTMEASEMTGPAPRKKAETTNKGVMGQVRKFGNWVRSGAGIGSPKGDVEAEERLHRHITEPRRTRLSFVRPSGDTSKESKDGEVEVYRRPGQQETIVIHGPRDPEHIHYPNRQSSPSSPRRQYGTNIRNNSSWEDPIRIVETSPERLPVPSPPRRRTRATEARIDFARYTTAGTISPTRRTVRYVDPGRDDSGRTVHVNRSRRQVAYHEEPGLGGVEYDVSGGRRAKRPLVPSGERVHRAGSESDESGDRDMIPIDRTDFL